MIIEDFKEILERFPMESKKAFKNNKFASKMRNEMNNDFKEFVFSIIPDNDKYHLKISPGMVKWADRPWAGLLNKDVTDTFQSGLYLAYFFDFEKNGFYLSLDQGVYNSSKKIRKKISNHLIDLISEIPQGFVCDETKLYDDTILSKFYNIGDVSMSELRDDLKIMIEIYESLIQPYLDYLCGEKSFADDLRPKKDTIRIWRITPGLSENHDEVWEEFKKESFVGIISDGDFTQFNNKFAVKHYLNKSLFINDDYANTLWKFIKWIRKDDIIIVNKGKHKLAGIGVVKSDGISHIENDYNLNNVYSVDWIFTPDDLEVNKNLFGKNTIAEWTDLCEKWNELLFTLSRSDDDLKDRLLTYVFSSFNNNYLKKKIGKNHQKNYEKEEEYIKTNWDEIIKDESKGQNISDEIWDKIINRPNKVHTDAISDIKSAMRNKFNYSDDDLTQVAILYYNTINKLINSDDEKEQKEILKDYDDNRYGDDFATGRITPVVHYLNPDFYVINQKTISMVNLMSLILGERLELNSSLEKYIDNNNKYKTFLNKLDRISPYEIHISTFEVADAFAHWMSDKSLGNYTGKNPKLIPPKLILEDNDKKDCDVDDLFDFPENLEDSEIDVFKDIYCHIKKWRDKLSGEGITIDEYFKHQSISNEYDDLTSIFKNLQSAGFLKLISDDDNRYVIVEKVSNEYLPVDFNNDLVESKLTGFEINDDVIYQICAALNSGKHIIFDGTPGTGKTELAIKFSSAGSDNRFNDGFILTTATSDWTTFDTIGGLMPKNDGTLEFKAGKFLQAIEENKWLIIDEINRADIDKSFGQLFTVLSGHDVELPFSENGKAIKIKVWDEYYCKHDLKTATYYIGSNWRIIGTMNVDDKDSLFDLSYAFMRRFMFIEVELPLEKEYINLIEQWSNNLNSTYQDTLRALYGIIEYKKIGPAIFKDMISYIIQREKNSSDEGKKIIGEAVNAYILPQLEGSNRIDEIEELFKSIGLSDYISEKFNNLKNEL